MPGTRNIPDVGSNIPVADASHVYRLDQDCAFPHRLGILERFSLDLSLGSDGQPLTPVEHPRVQSRLDRQRSQRRPVARTALALARDAVTTPEKG